MILYRMYARLDDHRTADQIQPMLTQPVKRVSRTSTARALEAFAQFLARNPPAGRNALAYVELRRADGSCETLAKRKASGKAPFAWESAS